MSAPVAERPHLPVKRTYQAGQPALIWQFLNQPPRENHSYSAVSLFSGAGISDLGYRQAGFDFLVQVEQEMRRAALGQANFPESRWLVGDVRELHEEIARVTLERLQGRSLDLLCATPPCQGMSSSNPGRGRRRSDVARALEDKNKLILELIPLAQKLRPRVIVAENVTQLRTLGVAHEDGDVGVLELLRRGLGDDYQVYDGSVNVAHYGIPQTRRRAVIVAVRRGSAWSGTDARGMSVPPWPVSTHGPSGTPGKHAWVTMREWLKFMNYQALDSASPVTAAGDHPLHQVPHYPLERYALIADIPPYSGQSAYQNSTCSGCGHSSVPIGLAVCPLCAEPLHNRPIVKDEQGFRLVKGFVSSYRRMHPDEPAATVTTASNHLGSDYKIHPWENRLLSLLECADLQTVPRSYDWSLALKPTKALQFQGKPLMTVMREVVGEAFPAYFTYLHGTFLVNEILEFA